MLKESIDRQETKILVVDDNEDLSLAMELRLRASHYHTLLARDGATAISLALAERPAAIILDLSLANEDGSALLKEFKKSPELSCIPVIIVTADRSPRKKRQVLDAGAKAYFEKPIDHQSLLATLLQIKSEQQNTLLFTSEPAMKVQI